jgi:hypothetical protein
MSNHQHQYQLHVIKLTKRYPTEGSFHATTISRQSPFQVEYLDGLTGVECQYILGVIASRIPTTIQGVGLSTHGEM